MEPLNYLMKSRDSGATLSFVRRPVRDDFNVLEQQNCFIEPQCTQYVLTSDALSEEANQAKREKSEVETKLTECHNKDISAGQEKEELLGKVQQLESTNQSLEQQIQELTAQIQTLNSQLAAKEAAPAEPAAEA